MKDARTEMPADQVSGPKRKVWTGALFINACLTLHAVLVYAFLFLPILVIVAYSFNSGRLMLVWQGFSLAPYWRAFSNAQMTESVATSLKVAGIAATIATVLGSLAGLYLARHPGWGSRLFVILISIVLVTPEIVNAIALLPWFVFLGVDAGMSVFSQGLVRLAIGHAILPTALVAFIVKSRMSGLNANLEEAAADLYATSFQGFHQITIPVMLPAIVAGALLALALGITTHGLRTTLLGGLGGLIIMLVFYFFGVLFARKRAKRMRDNGLDSDDEESLGQGDVILVTILGFLVGWPLIWFMIILSTLLGGIISLFLIIGMLINRRYNTDALMVFIPYGPYFITGATLIMYFPGFLQALLPV